MKKEEERTGRSLKQLNYLFGEKEAVYHGFAVKLGVSDSVMKILYALYDNGDGGRCPLREILRRSALSKQTANSALRKLEKEGILFLESDSGKTKTVRLTSAGKTFARKTAGRLMKMENEIFSEWSEGDMQKYIGFEERFLLQIRKKLKEFRPL